MNGGLRAAPRGLGRERAYSRPPRLMDAFLLLQLPPWDYILIHNLTKPYFIRVTQPAILSWHGPRNPGATRRAALAGLDKGGPRHGVGGRGGISAGTTPRQARRGGRDPR